MQLLHRHQMEEFYAEAGYVLERPEARASFGSLRPLADVRAACARLGVRALRVEVGHDNAPAQAVYRAAGFETLDRRLMAARLDGPATRR